MALPIRSHLNARIAAAFVGFFGGFAVFDFFVFGSPPRNFGLTALLFFGSIFGGAYLAQLAFSHASPAACPACGAASAVPTPRNPVLYACRSCGAETDAVKAMLAEALAKMRTQAQGEDRPKLPWVFLVVGVVAVGVAVWLAQDSIQLLREGVSTEARVMKVTTRASRDSEGRSETTYTAFIEYRAGKTPLTLERSWSVEDGGHCMWPCYDRGEQLKVIYLPGEPYRAKVHSLSELFVAPVLVGFVGFAFALFGGLMLRRKK
jgi:hypothetical protein